MIHVGEQVFDVVGERGWFIARVVVLETLYVRRSRSLSFSRRNLGACVWTATNELNGTERIKAELEISIFLRSFKSYHRVARNH